MFTRSLFVAATTVAAATMAAAPALATDEPAPPATQPTPKACVDNVRPVSRLSGNLQASLRKGVIRGIAIDQGCGAAGAGKLRTVSVSISRRVGKRCQHLLANGRFSRAGSCATHVYLKAKGGKTWTFRLRHKLSAGKYVVSSRAVDSAGNVERRGH